MFSRILIPNAPSKLYRTSSYLFLSPYTAVQEAEREQEGVPDGKRADSRRYFTGEGI